MLQVLYVDLYGILWRTAVAAATPAFKMRGRAGVLPRGVVATKIQCLVDGWLMNGGCWVLRGHP